MPPKLTHPTTQLAHSVYQLLVRMLIVLMLVALLWLLQLYGRGFVTSFWLLVVIVLGGCIGYGGWRRRRSQRAAWLAAYLSPASVWQARWRGGVLMAGVQFVLGLIWAVLLCVGVMRLHSVTAWWLLLVNLPLLVLVQRGVSSVCAGQVAARFLPEWSWRVSGRVMLLVMLPGYLALALHTAYPAFAEVSLERAVWHLMDQERARSAWLQTALQLAAAQDALRYWLAQQGIAALPAAPMVLVSWLLVLADEALLIWPCLLLCQGVLIGFEPEGRHYER